MTNIFHDADVTARARWERSRRPSRRNPRSLPCPTCKEPNRLTAADRASGYQCNACADRDEGGGY